MEIVNFQYSFCGESHGHPTGINRKTMKAVNNCWGKLKSQRKIATKENYRGDRTTTFSAVWRNQILEALFTVLLAFVLNEADIQKSPIASLIGTHKVLRTPCQSSGQDVSASKHLLSVRI